MKRTFIILVGLLLSVSILQAQDDPTKNNKKKERKISLYGEVYDSFTKAKVKAFVTLMRQDSTVVDTMTCWTWGTESYYELKIPAVQGHYIIKGTCEGYEDSYLDYHLRYIARNNYFKLPRLLMKKKQDDIWRESELEEVVAKGTKVKIAYRGDTVVYNASAFNLPEGSMLDGLIRQMPGAELKDNGDVYINGKKVDCLTLNGKDFFKGQNKVMLDNLPYFTVQSIKVYDKSTRQSELIGHDVEKRDYVMDVVLKREYNRGYLANIEAGGGTDNRYLVRLFGLYYDDHSRASVFANTNNINENRRPGGDGDWQPSSMPQGLRTTRQTGLHLEVEDKDKRWEEEFDTTFDWSEADDETRTSTERFATEGNLFGGSLTRNLQKDFRFSVDNRFVMKEPFSVSSTFSVNYVNGHRHSESRDSSFRTAIVNRTRNESKNRYRSMGLSGSLNYNKKFDWGDNVTITLSGSYNRNKPSESFTLNHTNYVQNDSTDLRHYYNDAHSEEYNYHIGGNYTLQLPDNWYIGANVSYDQSMNNSVNDYYRLDWLTEVAADKQQLEWLPSTNALLMSSIDLLNNGHENLLARKYRGMLGVTRSTDKGYLYMYLPVVHTRERLDYCEESFDTIARRSYTHFDPNFGFYNWRTKLGLRSANYSMSINRPSLSSLLPFDDTTNPLVMTLNNPDLKPTVTHSFGALFVANNDSLQRFFNLWTSASIIQHSVGTRSLYDPETGYYILMQDNVSGNWSWDLGTSYEMPLDNKKLLRLTQRANVDYTHSVDFDVLYVTPESQQTEDGKSTVHNWTLHERLALEYQKDKLTIGIRGEINWRSATSHRQNFERISALDYNYGGHLRYTIPWVKLSLSTDLRMFSRRGYQSSMMNTDDLVWNTELGRTFFKDKLTMKLTAFDLLHQLSSKQYSVNAQGRTETWNNCIPRYVMLSLMYKFTKKPQKQ